MQRPFLATIEQTQNGYRVRIEISIGFAGEVHRGVAEGVADPQHRPRLVGEATLRAVEPGFTGVEQVQTLRIAIPASVVADPARVVRMQHDIVAALARFQA